MAKADKSTLDIHIERKEMRNALVYALPSVLNKYGDALKRFAPSKSFISYARYRVWNGDALKRSAPIESAISYALYRVRNSDALKRVAA